MNWWAVGSYPEITIPFLLKKNKEKRSERLLRRKDLMLYDYFSRNTSFLLIS
jgi:hypothetical protein